MKRAYSVIAPAFFLGAAVGVSCGGTGTGIGFDLDGGFGGAGSPGGTGGSGTAGAGAGGPGGTAGAGARGGTTGTGGNTGSGSGGTSGSGTGGTAGSGSGGTPSSASFGCPVNPSQCTDGKDNDGDGKIDSADPECSGPCDNDEGTFATGIPGDNKDDTASCKQDCFFDGNSGGEDDGCQFDLRCDPARTMAQACRSGTQPPGIRCDRDSDWAKCKRVCGRFTPNGCDCFGCCALTNSDVYVRLARECTAATINDPQKCQRCTPVKECVNTCDKCEVCVGKPAPDPGCQIPPPSGSGGSGGTGGSGGSGGTPCPQGVTYCGPGGSACTGGTYCLTGCCVTFE